MNGRLDDLTPEEKEQLGRAGASLEDLNRHHANCPSAETLTASKEGVLPEALAASVRAHADKCIFCQTLLNDLTSEELVSGTSVERARVREHVLALIRPAVQENKVGGGFLALWWWRGLAATALAAAAIALVVWTRVHEPKIAEPVSVAVGKPEQKPLTIPASMEWKKLPIRLQAQSVLIWRGAPRNAKEKYAKELGAALAFYRDDQFQEAARHLAQLAKDYPQGIEGQLYLGISELKLEQNSDAVAPLTASQQMGPEQFRDDATWYLALALLRTGDRVKSAEELQKLCGGTSSYSSRACNAAKEIAKP